MPHKYVVIYKHKSQNNQNLYAREISGDSATYALNNFTRDFSDCLPVAITDFKSNFNFYGALWEVQQIEEYNLTNNLVKEIST